MITQEFLIDLEQWNFTHTRVTPDSLLSSYGTHVERRLIVVASLDTSPGISILSLHFSLYNTFIGFELDTTRLVSWYEMSIPLDHYLERWDRQALLKQFVYGNLFV